MIHVCLTNQCNRHCSHCVEDGWFLADATRQVQNMHLDVFSYILKLVRDGIVLCGGEVLLYPQLENVLSICREKCCKVDISSNLCVDSHIIHNIVENYFGEIRVWSVRLDYEDSERDLFLNNFFQYVVNKTAFVLHVTMSPEEGALEKNIQRINDLLSNFDVKTKPPIMLGFPMPIPGRGMVVYNYTNDVLRLIDEVRQKNGMVEFNIEQTLADCELSYDLLKDKSKFTNVSEDYHCGMNDFYFLPNRSVIKCLSCPTIMVPDLFCFENMEQLDDALRSSRAKAWKTTTFTRFCRTCNGLNPGRCLGFCVAKRMCLN